MAKANVASVVCQRYIVLGEREQITTFTALLLMRLQAEFEIICLMKRQTMVEPFTVKHRENNP